jgi:Putative zinc-finger
MTCQMMMSLGVYVLGAADAEESRQVRAHLPGCPACRAELALLRPLPGLLAGVPEGALDAEPHLGPVAGKRVDWAAGRRRGQAAGGRRGSGSGGRRGQAAVGGRLGQAAGGRRGSGADRGADGSAALVPGRAAGRSAPVASRRHSARTWRAAAMAAAVAAIAGAAGGFWLAPRSASHRPATVTLSGANPALHVTATAALTATSWGTSIQLRVDGIPLNAPCRLIVRSRAGATEITGVWDAWHTGPITVPASAGWLPSDIASLQVATTTGKLVTISVPPRGIG